MKVKKEIIITEQDSNKRIDRYLTDNYPHISRNQWQERIKNGNVLVNEKPVRNSYILKTNDIITFYYYKKPEPEVNHHFKIIFEDDDLLIIDKPPNLPVHPSGNYKKNTLYTLLKEQYNYEYCHPINRIDRETSGLILFGKNPEIIRNISKIFLTNQISKIYYTIVFGKFTKHQILEGYIGKHIHSKVIKRQMFINKNSLMDFLKLYKNNYSDNTESFTIFYNNHNYIYRYAKTEFIPEKIKTIEHPLYNEITLIKVKLYTGRTHQIRATLKDSGFPIVGDKIYGLNENYFLKFLDDTINNRDYQILLLNRCALHCYEMSFVHPGTKKLISIKSSLPEDFQTLLK
ncbi:MAG: pseudouridylate synthase [Leptospiraceae bacterium]|nr:MAG: pseudouridylate synthase [Leptospiraceae bacterium]